MTTKIVISTVLVLTLASCNNGRVQDNPKESTPKALEDKTSSYEIVSGRGNIDLVENLYDELVSKNIELRKLESEINDLNESQLDSTRLFKKFNEKNQSYFSSADQHISEIKDSLLRDKMKVLIVNNLAKYSLYTARHNQLLEIIEDKSLTISDIHHSLKILKTLPLIEKYQQDYLPNTKSLEGYIKRQEETIKLADSLTKN